MKKNPTFSKLQKSKKTMKIADLYYYQLGIFMFQLAKHDLPQTISMMFSPNKSLHAYQTRQANYFHLPLVKTSSAKKSIKFEGPKFWNSLGQSLREVSSLSKFKTKLKQFIFEKYQCL